MIKFQLERILRQKAEAAERKHKRDTMPYIQVVEYNPVKGTTRREIKHYSINKSSVQEETYVALNWCIVYIKGNPSHMGKQLRLLAQYRILF